MTRIPSILLIGAFALLVACEEQPPAVSTDLINIAPSADNNRSSTSLPEIAFTDTVHDFGAISEGEKVRHTYAFENTGNEPLIISKVEPSCGCTAVEDWSSRPYAPGESGTITIEFNSDKRPGKQHKTISIITNCYPSVHQLTLQGMVIGPEPH